MYLGLDLMRKHCDKTRDIKYNNRHQQTLKVKHKRPDFMLKYFSVLKVFLR